MELQPPLPPLVLPRAAWWVPGAHLQTAYARIARSRWLVRFAREILTTPDDDDLVLDHADPDLAPPPGTPRVLVVPGLEGHAHSLHTQGLAHLVVRAGWRVTVFHFRSCARDHADLRRLRNRRPRLYHFGDTADLDLAVRRLAAREPAAPLYALGFSLGGNVLLKWLGEAGAASAVRGAATLSVPYDLAAAVRYLERPVGRWYFRRFRRRLLGKVLDVMARFPRETAHLDAGRVRAARTFLELDRAATAPLHGFASADAYHAEASSRPRLPDIAAPTLCINAEDDPFFPADALAAAAAAVPTRAVTFEVTRWGGHTGFVAGRWPWRPDYWAEARSLAWLQALHARGV